MDPVTFAIITGLITNGLWSVSTHVWRKSYQALKTQENPPSLQEPDTELAPLLQEDIAFATSSEQFGSQLQAEQLQSFLTSADIEAIVRQIYASLLTPGSTNIHLESIRAEFWASLSLHLGKPKDSICDLAEVLLNVLLTGCRRALEIFNEQGGILATNAAFSATNDCLILDELAAIQKNLTFLTTQQLPSIKEIIDFECKYRQQVINRHGYITPPYVDATRKLPIDELYVPSDFTTIPKQKDEKPENLTMPDFRRWLYRAVLLGNPGGGKSTFSQKLCYDLATRYSERLFAGRQVTPVLVVLRDYGAQKKVHNCSILQFIEVTANSKYQVQPPSRVFEYMLLNGRVVVIFDGLDELIDTSYRQEISSDVESFCTLYPSVPVVVTSREVGYQQAPLDECRFDIFHLAPFQEQQVQKYVTNWFAVDLDLTPEQQEQKVEAFLEESQTVPDLRSNPLMLGLMCNIYRGEGYIPMNRPDIYEKCAVMLFERWDKGRGIYVPLPIEAHIRPAMMHLAYWIYSDEALQGGVTERKLVEKATDYLCQRRFEDRDEAEQAAREFIQFCRGRAWVFTDTGTTKAGESFYQFTHRTFLEYFAAAYLVRTYPTPEKLAEILLPKIAKQEWDVVAQLAFQLQNKNIEGAGDELLSALIDKAAQTQVDEGWNLLFFAARSLEFIVPSPRVTRDIARAYIECSIAWKIDDIKRGKYCQIEFGDHWEEFEIEELLNSLFSAAIENQANITDAVEKLLIKTVNDRSELTSILALELIVTLDFSENFWKPSSQRIFNTCFEQLESLSKKYLQLGIYIHWLQKNSIIDLIKWHGFQSVLHISDLSCCSVWLPCPAESLISNISTATYLSESLTWSDKYLQDLKEVGRISLSHSLPFSVQQLDLNLGWTTLLSTLKAIECRQPQEALALDSEAIFGVFILLAMMLEESAEQNLQKAIEQIRKSKSSLFNSIRWTFIARFEPAETDKVQAEFDYCGFTLEQQIFAWRWVQREINFVKQVVVSSSQGAIPESE